MRDQQTNDKKLKYHTQNYILDIPQELLNYINLTYDSNGSS